ncbi:IS30 family transposase, partial [Allochromatium vinosum]|nr:IS30 family transposase [Allochromatium vinosum]
MGRSHGWGAEQTGRAAMRSPGRPGVNQRDAKRAFWQRIAEGLSSEDAALVCGVSPPVGSRWFR